MATFGPQLGYDLSSPVRTQAVPGAFDSYQSQQKPFNEAQKQEFLKQHGYSTQESHDLMAGRNPIAKNTVQYAPKQTAKAGAGMAKNGLALSPDTLSMLRSQQVPDDVIADEMAKTSPHFASQLQKIRKKFQGDPDATSAFLNTRFYGDPQYNPAKNDPEKGKNYVTKTLDHIYQSAQDVLGEGGVMQQYNRGDINALQAVNRSAQAIYHGALTPVLDPVNDLTKFALDKTGASGLIQSGVQAARESEIGKAVEPYVQGAIEGYKNLPAGSPIRDLASAGQAGLDTLTVLGADAAVKMGQRAVGQAVKHPFQTIRHPIQSGKSVWTGETMSTGTQGPTTETRQLTGTAKTAVDKGMDEKFMTFVADQNADTRAVMSKMTEAAKEGGDVLGGTVKHKEILGGQMMDSAAYVLEKKQAIGKAIGAMKTSLADEMINLSDDYDDLLVQLRSKGAVVNDDGKILSLAGAADDNIPLLQKTLDFLQPDDTGRVIRSGKEIDMWRTKMFEEMNSAKAKLQPSAAGQSTFGFAEKVANDVRRSSLVRMAKDNTNLLAANDAYEELSTAASKYLKAIGYKGRLKIEDITAKQLRAGEVALRTLGNASADTREAFQQLIQTAQKYGRVSGVDDMALIRYADALEDVFPITPTRSLGGQVSRATRDAAGKLTQDVVEGKGLSRSITERLTEPVMKVYDKVRGLTPENRYKLLMEVLNSPEDTQFFTVVKKAIPTEAAKLKSASKGVDAGDMKAVAKEELSNLTLEEKTTGLIGGGGDNMPRFSDATSGQVVEVPIESIKYDPSQLSEAMKDVSAGSTSMTGTPISVSNLKGVPTMVNGYHRLAEAMQKGLKTIPVKLQ